ncbi:MAG TPA: alpha/beta hydrolase domain-containing protein [Bryobacteraceae bacterium]|jgi:hypothetical protein|nr:alpha/beta hydrolase domain-containing protein [Bryobacteraceae bacterium]
MKYFVCLVTFAAAAFAQKVTGPIPITADSHPFLAADHNLQPMNLAKLGYVEEEFVITGTANVYDWAADGALTVKTPNVPYGTRILLRRPADSARFNGSVVVELPNTARRFDWSMMWGYVHNYVTDQGAAWVAISMPGAIQLEKKFDPARYAALSFANPTPAEACSTGPGPGGNNATSDIEDGLRWDAISQVAAALKNGSLAGFKAQRVYLTTQGGDVMTYINAVHSRAKVYDGYVIKSPGGPSRISRCAPAPGRGDPRQMIKNVGVPVIAVVPQGEVAEAAAIRRADSDEPNDRFRWYEIAGVAHIDNAPYVALPSFDDQAKTGAMPQGTPSWPFNVRCEPEIPLEEHPLLTYVFDAAFANLDLWLTKGIAPPRADRIELTDGKVALDKFGNGIGGVRSFDVDVPVATYYTTTAGPGTCRELGHEDRFDWAAMESVYGSYKNYASKVSQSVDRMVKERWLTEADARRIRESEDEKSKIKAQKSKAKSD